MPQFCDVALPVPLDTVFTYRVNGTDPPVGARVLVPFRNERMTGVVVALHDRAPTVKTKDVLTVLDAAPALDATLIKLADWIAGYYLAPLGEVFRTMLPLAAEVRRAKQYSITATGLAALHAGAEAGSSRRSQRSRQEQDIEYAVLNRLADEPAREATLRSALGATRELLAGMVRKKWIAREDISARQDATRTEKIAVLKHGPASSSDDGARSPSTGRRNKLTAGQEHVLEVLSQAGGRLRWLDLLAHDDVSRSSAETLVRRGLIAIAEQPVTFTMTTLSAKPPQPRLNAAQQASFDAITGAARSGFSVSLLHGVTGSGKTAVYLAALDAVLAAGASALLLVPEIGLTPAAVAEVAQAFGARAAILHSALTEPERAEQWHRIRRGDARIVVGTRSAVFAPLRDLALIIVDEEHDNSYKQDESPRYHARDVAVMRGKLSGAAVVLGSATPSLESYQNAQSGKYRFLELRDRVEQRPLPAVEIVDMRAEFAATGDDRLVSRRLASALGERLARGEQTLVLLNRRGYAPVVLCRTCGETVECQNCAISLTHHLRSRRLECHYCGFTRPVPLTCPKCGSEYVQFLGSGSERLEETLHGLFPRARIARLDRDTVRTRHDIERVLAALNAGEIDVLVGTQMIAKGHDVHGVTLVGIVGADMALGLPDFRAAERTFQLLTQASGRAGRGLTAGEVVLQTWSPDHYAVQFAAQHDYRGFFDKEIQFRRWMHYPPFTALANVLVRGPELQQTLAIVSRLGAWFRDERHPGVRVLGPAPAPLVRLKRDFRYHFLLKSASRKVLHTTLRALLALAAEHKVTRQNLIIDVDALSLL